MKEEMRERNARYAAMAAEERILRMYDEFDRVLFTSSFGTSAAVLLHMTAALRPKQKVHFIDTTYHFSETLEYRNKLTAHLGLEVVNVLPAKWKNDFTRSDATWTKDPDLCCSINKVEPLDGLLPEYDIWMSGLMHHQNKERKRREIFEPRGNLHKFHPIIDMNEEQVKAYFKKHGLPEHPLQRAGFHSIGCAQCTFKGKGRAGRWGNSSKTECGLHL